MKITNFTDLFAWQKSHKLVLDIYEITKKFPREEMYGLTNQIRRASVSVSSCIAEGFSRGTSKDKTQFYRMSMGSLTEVQNQLLISKDLDYISKKEYEHSFELSVEVQKLIFGLIRSIKG